MKTAGVFMVLTLVLLCCFSGVASESSNQLQNDCSAYPEPPKGQTLLCKTEYRPVCGTNGVTYNNKCFLCLAKWQTGGRLSLQHEEVCMKKIDCSRYPRTKDPRKIACPRNFEPVCGTDGVTYSNECVLCVAILNGANIDLAHEGKCKEKIDCSRYQRIKDPRKIACPRIYAPVCGTNGVTYDNECVLCAEILKGATVRLAHKGQCMVKDDCGGYPKPQKGKQFACPLIYRPVCGTNGITYSNKCNLCAARWQTGINIGIKHEGRCNRKIN